MQLRALITSGHRPDTFRSALWTKAVTLMDKKAIPKTPLCLEYSALFLSHSPQYGHKDSS